MSKRGKRKRKNRPRSRSKRGRQHGNPGWHLKLEEFRREAKAKAPEVVTCSMKGWELHLSYKEDQRQCSGAGVDDCVWSGRADQLDEDRCPDCTSPVAAEPWALAAHPERENNDYTWLGRAAEFLGAPPEDKPEKPAKGEKTVVMFSWAERVPANPLGGA